MSFHLRLPLWLPKASARGPGVLIHSRAADWPIFVRASEQAASEMFAPTRPRLCKFNQKWEKAWNMGNVSVVAGWSEGGLWDGWIGQRGLCCHKSSFGNWSVREEPGGKGGLEKGVKGDELGPGRAWRACVACVCRGAGALGGSQCLGQFARAD